MPCTPNGRHCRGQIHLVNAAGAVTRVAVGQYGLRRGTHWTSLGFMYIYTVLAEEASMSATVGLRTGSGQVDVRCP